MADYRNVWALIAAVAFLQLGGGILGIVTPLGLDRIGADELTIGLIAALHAGGYMIGAWYAPALIRVFGNIRVYCAAATVAGVTVLFMQLALDIAAWTAIRLVQGAAFSLMFSSAEAWLGAATPAKRRGAVSGLYHVVAKAALIVGPFFVAGLAATDARPFMWCAIFLSLSLLPICLTRRGEPQSPDKTPLSFKKLFEIAPAAVIAVFLAGVINTGTLALLPLYADIALEMINHNATTAAAIAAAAVWAGGLISQWPAGRISDHIDRRIVIAAMGIAAGFASFALGVSHLFPATFIILLLVVWGAGSLSFYGVAVAHAIDRAEARQISQVMAGLLFVWAAGSVVGPLASGVALRTPVGPGGMFLLAGGFSVILVLAMLWRRVSKEQPDEAEQEPWNPAMPTLATKGEVDPRVE